MFHEQLIYSLYMYTKPEFEYQNNIKFTEISLPTTNTYNAPSYSDTYAYNYHFNKAFIFVNISRIGAENQYGLRSLFHSQDKLLVTIFPVLYYVCVCFVFRYHVLCTVYFYIHRLNFIMFIIVNGVVYVFKL